MTWRYKKKVEEVLTCLLLSSQHPFPPVRSCSCCLSWGSEETRTVFLYQLCRSSPLYRCHPALLPCDLHSCSLCSKSCVGLQAGSCSVQTGIQNIQLPFFGKSLRNHWNRSQTATAVVPSHFWPQTQWMLAAWQNDRFYSKLVSWWLQGQRRRPGRRKGCTTSGYWGDTSASVHCVYLLSPRTHLCESWEVVEMRQL